MMELFLFLFMGLSFLANGTIFLKIIRLRMNDDLPSFFFSIAAFVTGVIFYAYFWFVTGLVGLLGLYSVWFYGGISLVSLILGWKQLSFLPAAFRKFFLKIRHAGWINVLIASEIFVIFLFTFSRCWASYVDGDSLVYHLYLPKMFVLMGKIWHIPYSEHAFWPLLAEMSFVPGEVLHTIVLSKAVSFLLYVALSLSCGYFVWTRTQNMTASLLTTLLIAGGPVFFFHAPSTYNDIFFSTFLIMALLLMRMESSKGKGWGVSFLAGLFCGAAVATKYLALYGVVAMSPVILLEWFQGHQKKQVFRNNLLFLFGLTLAGLPFYLRSWIVYGNPVFPFAQKIFGTPFGYGLTQAGLVGSNVSHFIAGTGKGVLDFILLPVSMTFKPALFGGDKLGLLFLVSFPLMLFSFRKHLYLWCFLLVYTVIWFNLSQYTRYLLPGLALVAVLSGIGFANVQKRYARLAQVMGATFVLIGFIQLLWAGYHVKKDFFVRTSDPARGMGQWVSARINNPKEKVLLVGDNKAYYYDLIAIREMTFRNFTRYPDFDREEKTVQLLDKNDIRHIAIVADSHPYSQSRQSEDRFRPEPYFKELTRVGYYENISEKVGSQGLKYDVYRRTTKPI
ncbi:MAG: hypothetical protein JW893_03755 [Candidatus Omnitrophica bacterium]|nr:hypothetical protein [Candidatus Omnitrophota bacterium]